MGTGAMGPSRVGWVLLAVVVLCAVHTQASRDLLYTATVSTNGMARASHMVSTTNAQRANLESKLAGSNERVFLTSNENSILYIPPKDYDRRRPPPKGPTEVKFSLILTKLYSVNENDGTLRMTLETTMMWKDTRLAYEQYGNILQGSERFITLESWEVWSPELDFHGAILDGEQHSQARVFPDGTVYFLRVADYLMAVELDLRWFPFDDQELIMEAYIWDHSEDSVKLVLSEDWIPWTTSNRTESFSISGSMDVEKTHYILESLTGGVVSSTSSTSDSTVNWSGVRMTMHTYRKQLYYVLAYFIPLNIITLAASTSFYIAHTDSGSRISVSLSAILALIGMDYVMLAELPRCGYVLWIHFYIIGQFLLVLLPLFFHFVVVHFSFFDPEVGEDAENGDEVVEGKTFDESAVKLPHQVGPSFKDYLKKISNISSYFFPSGWGVPIVRKVDNCGFVLFIVLFTLFNIIMFTLGALNKLHADVSNHLSVVSQPDP